METKILTIPEVAEYLKISKAKIYLLVSKNEIPHIRLGRNVRIKESDLIRWLEKQTYSMN
jgi:excisionase family DNA binding protein